MIRNTSKIEELILFLRGYSPVFIKDKTEKFMRMAKDLKPGRVKLYFYLDLKERDFAALGPLQMLQAELEKNGIETETNWFPLCLRLIQDRPVLLEYFRAIGDCSKCFLSKKGNCDLQNARMLSV